MELFQKYKLHNVIYGLTIGITILLFFFSKGEIDTPQIENEPAKEKQILLSYERLYSTSINCN